MTSILIIGGGGREHALAWKLKQSPMCEKLYIAPGNAGTAKLGENVTINLKDNDAVVQFAKEKSVGLVVVAPDDFLAQGMVDSLTEAGIPAFGPTQAAAKLEWSKAFAKEFMKSNGIPCAISETFNTSAAARLFAAELLKKTGKVVIKADGLALGKGVVIADSEDDINATLTSFIDDAIFGESGKTVIVEEYLEGVEVSIHAFTDGETVRMFPVARDHKRIGDGNTGLNTGGMGTIAPVVVPQDFLKEVEETIVLPVIRAMNKAGTPFSGVLFPGLMVTKDGPKVLEFNARFGDPETQSYMRILDSDLLEIMEAIAARNLTAVDVKWSDKSAATVVMASKGYPGTYEKGKLISGTMEAETESVVVFYAGAALVGDTLFTSGGRVLGVSATGDSIEAARANAYTAVHKIRFDGAQFRSDIGIKFDI